MSNIKLSFIVPVYNVERYLRKCVDSLLAQDYGDYEIILVDDGSTDNSGAICHEYASPSLASLHQSTIPIRVIHQPNAGLSAARNSGIKAAIGEYICFVDSDDYWQPNVLAGLMAQIKRDNLDVLRFDFQNVNEKYEIIHPNKAQKRELDLSESVTDGVAFLTERLGPCCYAWQFILRRDLIVGDQPSFQQVLFTPAIYFEDTDWTPRMLIRVKRVASVQTIVYNYLWRPGSITLPTDSAKREKVLRDKLSLIRGFYEQQKLVQNPIWFTWMISFNTMSILGVLTSLPSKERKEYIAELKSLCVFPLSTHRTNRNERIKIWIANLSPNLYCNLMRLRK